MRLLKLILVSSGLVLAASLADDNIPAGSQTIYFLDNNPDGAAIVSLRISLDNGFLSNPVRIPTGGNGMFAIKNGTNPPTGNAAAA